jgi:hypothetical protein
MSSRAYPASGASSPSPLHKERDIHRRRQLNRSASDSLIYLVLQCNSLPLLPDDID